MAFCWAFPCSILSVILHRLFIASPQTKALVGAGDVAASVLAGFTFILGFLVVFRSQQAYARWWEGGTLLQQLRGEWFNAYSNLMAFCNTSLDRADEVEEFQHKLVRLVSLLYCAAIQQVSTMKNQNYELIDIRDFNQDSLLFLGAAHDQCEVCLQWIQRLIGEANEAQVIKVSPPILSRVYNQLGNGIVNLNNARKITEFPIPFPLAQMITFMLLFHWGITAFVCAASVENTFWAGLITFIVVFSFWSINYIAVELEQPFGDDANDLPLHDMQIDLNQSLESLLDKRAQIPPIFNFKKEHLKVGKSREGINELIRNSQVERDKGPTQTDHGEERLDPSQPRDACSNVESSSEHSQQPASSSTWKHTPDERIFGRATELEGSLIPPMLHVTVSDELKSCGSGEPGQEPPPPPKTEDECHQAGTNFSSTHVEEPWTCGDGRKRPPTLSTAQRSGWPWNCDMISGCRAPAIEEKRRETTTTSTNVASRGDVVPCVDMSSSNRSNGTTKTAVSLRL